MPTPIDVWIIGGQSNASGTGGDPSRSFNVPTTSAFEYDPGTDSLVKPLDDKLVYSSGGGGTAWPAFAFIWHRQTKRLSCYVQEADSGASMHRDADLSGTWDPVASGNFSDPAITHTNEMLSHLESNNYDPTLRGMLWSQGERDGRAIKDGNLDKSQYKSKFEEVIQYFRDNLSAPDLRWCVWRTATEFDKPDEGWPQIREAQDEIAAADENVIMAYDETMQFQDRGWMDPDLLHYNQTGLNQMGIDGAKSIIDELRVRGEL